MGFEISGLDSLIDKLSKMEQNVEELDGKNNVPLSELLTNSYLKKNTKFKSLDELFDTYKLDMDEIEIEKLIETNEWNNYVKMNTKFKSWTDMLEDASGEWVKNKIFE
jgi:hypothetical protein